MEAVLEWRIVVWRLGAGIGAACGLLALMHDAPAWVACVRGGTACFLIAALGRFGERAIGSSPSAAAVDEEAERLSTSAAAAQARPQPNQRLR